MPSSYSKVIRRREKRLLLHVSQTSTKLIQMKRVLHYVDTFRIPYIGTEKEMGASPKFEVVQRSRNHSECDEIATAAGLRYCKLFSMRKKILCDRIFPSVSAH